MRAVGSRQDLKDRLPRALYRGVSLKADGSGEDQSLELAFLAWPLGMDRP